MKPTFESTVNILVQAYLKDELVHGDCSACAVANIVGHDGWKHLFVTIDRKDQIIAQQNECIIYRFPMGVVAVPIDEASDGTRIGRYEGLLAIEKSGYSVEQLASVEYAFETCPTGKGEDEHMFNGLMAVVDVLADIHQVDLTVKEQAKALFVKPVKDDSLFNQLANLNRP